MERVGRFALARLHIEARLAAAAQRGIGIFVRTSTLEQGDQATCGSPSMQLDMAFRDAEQLGGTRESVILIEAFGEEGTRRADRRKFRLLVRLVQQRQVGVVIVPEHHRLSRNVRDAEILFNAAADARVLLLIGGQTFDPRVPTERLILGQLAQMAQYENDSRIRWMLLGKYGRARQLRARFKLPTGLVWASRTDSAYMDAVAATGDLAIYKWLDEARGNRAFSPTRLMTYEILPYPDAAVFASLRLRVDWLVDTGCLATVVERIENGHAGWPQGQL